MKLIHEAAPFKCSDSIRPYLEKVFKGEYDVPLWDSGLTILDCGANVGAFAIWAHHRWPGSKIHCYEPHPKTFAVLQENIGKYRGDFHLSPYGLGDPGWRVLYNGANNEGEATLFPNLVSSGTGQHVEVVSPLTMPRGDILKIDCEGAELEILRPLIGDGRDFRAILIEYHHENFRREIDALLGRDYALIRCDINPHCHHIGTAIYLNKGELK